MKIFSLKNLIKATLIISAIFLVVLIPTHFAHAEFSMASFIGGASDVIQKFVGWILNAFLMICAWVLVAAGVILEWTMNMTVVKMSEIINDNGPDKIGHTLVLVWKFFRDLANMCFIFVLVYEGVKTILGRGNYRDVIKNIIIAGLFINFSMFLTKIPIDISNIFSIQLYNGITGYNGGNELNLTKGITGEFMNAVRLQSLYSTGSNSINSAASTAGSSFNNRLLIASVLGGVTMLLTAAIFFAISGVFIRRILIIGYLIMISPFYFLAMILPNVGSTMGKKWSQTLYAEATTAPIFFLQMFVAVMFLRSPAFLNNGGPFVIKSASTFSDALNGDLQSLAGLVLNYVVIMAMLLYALKAAIDAGGFGAKFIDSTVKKGQNFIRKTIPNRVGGAFKSAGVGIARKTVTAPLSVAGGVGGAMFRQTLGRASATIASGQANTGTREERAAKHGVVMGNVGYVAGKMGGEAISRGLAAVGRNLQKQASEDGLYGKIHRGALAVSKYLGEKASFDLNNTVLGKVAGTQEPTDAGENGKQFRGGFNDRTSARIKKIRERDSTINKARDEASKAVDIGAGLELNGKASAVTNLSDDQYKLAEANKVVELETKKLDEIENEAKKVAEKEETDRIKSTDALMAVRAAEEERIKLQKPTITTADLNMEIDRYMKTSAANDEINKYLETTAAKARISAYVATTTAGIRVDPKNQETAKKYATDEAKKYIENLKKGSAVNEIMGDIANIDKDTAVDKLVKMGVPKDEAESRIKKFLETRDKFKKRVEGLSTEDLNSMPAEKLVKMIPFLRTKQFEDLIKKDNKVFNKDEKKKFKKVRFAAIDDIKSDGVSEEQFQANVEKKIRSTSMTDSEYVTYITELTKKRGSIKGSEDWNKTEPLLKAAILAAPDGVIKKVTSKDNAGLDEEEKNSLGSYRSSRLDNALEALKKDRTSTLPADKLTPDQRNTLIKTIRTEIIRKRVSGEQLVKKGVSEITENPELLSQLSKETVTDMLKSEKFRSWSGDDRKKFGESIMKQFDHPARDTVTQEKNLPLIEHESKDVPNKIQSMMDYAKAHSAEIVIGSDLMKRIESVVSKGTGKKGKGGLKPEELINVINSDVGLEITKSSKLLSNKFTTKMIDDIKGNTDFLSIDPAKRKAFGDHLASQGDQKVKDMFDLTINRTAAKALRTAFSM